VISFAAAQRAAEVGDAWLSQASGTVDMSALPSHNVDHEGSPLPVRAIARLGTARMRHRRTRALEFSPDGATLYSAGQGGIRVWDAATGREVARHAPVPEREVVHALARSPDGATLATSAGENSVSIWDLTTGAPRCAPISWPTAPDRMHAPSGVIYLRFTPDGAALVAVAYDGSIRVLDATTGVVRLALLHGGRIEAAALSPDGRTLATGAPCDGAARIGLWDLVRGRSIRGLTAPNHSVTALAFTPRGDALISTGYGDTGKNQVARWDLASRRPAWKTRGSGEGACLLTVTCDGTRVVVAMPGEARVLDAASGETLRTISLEGVPDAAALAPCGSTLATAIYNGAIVLHPLVGAPAGPACASGAGAIERLVWSSDGETIAAADRREVRLYDVGAWRLRARKDLGPLPLEHRPIVIAPDAGLAAQAWGEEEIRVHSLAGGAAPVRRVLCRTVEPVAFQPDRPRLLARVGAPDAERRICIVDAHDGSTLRSLPEFHDGAFSPDGALLVAVSRESIAVFDAEGGREVWRVAAPGLKAPTFSPDGGEVAASDGDARIRIFDAARGALRATIPTGSPRRFAFALSPRGDVVACGELEGGVRLLERPGGREVARLTGDDSLVEALAFSPLGDLLVAATEGTAAIVYSLDLR